jgi:hypothetical protein
VSHHKALHQIVQDSLWQTRMCHKQTSGGAQLSVPGAFIGGPSSRAAFYFSVRWSFSDVEGQTGTNKTGNTKVKEQSLVTTRLWYIFHSSFMGTVEVRVEVIHN